MALFFYWRVVGRHAQVRWKGHFQGAAGRRGGVHATMPAGAGTRAGPGAFLLLSLGLLLPSGAPAARLPTSSGGLPAAAAVAWPFDPVTGEELPWPPKALLAVAEGQNVLFGSHEAAARFKVSELWAGAARMLRLTPPPNAQGQPEGVLPGREDSASGRPPARPARHAGPLRELP